MKNLCLFFIFLILLFTALPAKARQMPKIKPEKLYQMQNHVYDTSDYDMVWNSAIGVLYDNNFIVEDIDKTLGYIKATKTFKSKLTSKKRVAGWSAVLAAASAYTVFSYGATAYSMYSPTRRIANEMRDKTVQIKANVNIEKINENQTKVKFVLVEKFLQNADGFSFNTMAPVKILRIYKPYVYEEFFKQIENNISAL